MGILNHSAGAHIHAKMHDVNTNSPRSTGHLITYAIACVLLDEIDDKGLKVAKVQERAGISARSWSNYVGGHTEGVPLPQWAKVAEALGLRTSEVVARAEDRLDALDDADVQLLLTLSGPTAMMVMRDRGRTAGKGKTADPPDVTGERTMRSA